MSTATSIVSGSYQRPIEEVQDAPANSEVWFSDFKADMRRIAQERDQAAPMSALVTNPAFYLTKWGSASAANAAFNKLESYDKDTAQLTASAVLLLAVVIDVLGTQNGYAALTQRKKYLESLQDLVSAVEGGKLTNFELAEKAASCAKSLQAAEALPGWTEFISKIGTDERIEPQRTSPH